MALTDFPSNVSRWAPLLSIFFPTYLIEKALWVIQHESAGNPEAAGDGGMSIGLFQIQSQERFASRPPRRLLLVPHVNIRYAAWVLGAAGNKWGDWGEGTLYQGQNFGSLGARPYLPTLSPATPTPHIFTDKISAVNYPDVDTLALAIENMVTDDSHRAVVGPYLTEFKQRGGDIAMIDFSGHAIVPTPAVPPSEDDNGGGFPGFGLPDIGFPSIDFPDLPDLPDIGIPDLAEFFGDVQGLLQGFTTDILTKLSDEAAEIIKKVAAVEETARTNIVSGVKALDGIVGSAFEKIDTGLRSGFESIVKGTSAVTNKVIDKVGAITLGAIDKVSGIAMSTINKLDSLTGSIKDLVSGPLTTIAQGVKSQGAAIIEALAATPKLVKDSILSVSTAVLDGIEGAIGFLIGGLESVLSGIVALVATIAKALAETLPELLMAIGSGVGEIAAGAANLAGIFGGGIIGLLSGLSDFPTDIDDLIDMFTPSIQINRLI